MQALCGFPILSDVLQARLSVLRFSSLGSGPYYNGDGNDIITEVT